MCEWFAVCLRAKLIIKHVLDIKVNYNCVNEIDVNEKYKLRYNWFTHTPINLKNVTSESTINRIEDGIVSKKSMFMVYKCSIQSNCICLNV